MRVTDAVKVDHEFRHYRKAQTTLAAIERRWDWLSKHMPARLTDTHKINKDIISALLAREISRPRLAWEINTYLSSRPVLTLPTKHILDYIFVNLPEPGPAQLNPLEASLIDLMNIRHHQIAAQMHKFQLMCEIAWAAKNHWYMIFNTLTVRPEEYYNVFSRGSRTFKNYIRAVDRLTASAAYGSVRKAGGQDYHKYFAAVEEGGQTDRLHLHCIHCLRELPPLSIDPNKGALRPTNRELGTMQTLWPAGHSQPIMVRYSPQDAFGLAGYRWPIDHKTNMPMVIKSPLALSTYMSKYITKGFASCQRKSYQWRVRKSHNLGQNLLDELTASLSTSTLHVLTASDQIKASLNNTRIPQNLLRLASLKQLKNRPSTTSPSASTDITALAKRATPRLSPLHSLRVSTQTIHENNQQSTQYLSTVDCGPADISKAWHELQTASRKINKNYFPRNPGAYGTTSTRDHLYGS